MPIGIFYRSNIIWIVSYGSTTIILNFVNNIISQWTFSSSSFSIWTFCTTTLIMQYDMIQHDIIQYNKNPSYTTTIHLHSMFIIQLPLAFWRYFPVQIPKFLASVVVLIFVTFYSYFKVQNFLILKHFY